MSLPNFLSLEPARLENIKQLLIGKWKDENERIIEFLPDNRLTLYLKNGKVYDDFYYYLSEKKGALHLTSPGMGVLNGIIKTVTKDEIEYLDFSIPGQIFTNNSKLDLVKLTKM